MEYHLEAELLQEGSHHGKPVTAILPIQVRAPSTPYPLVNFDLQRRAFPSSVRAYRLVPGMENAELSLKKKSKQFFHSSKVPAIGFMVWTSCPAVIQLGNPTPIPFLVRIVADRKQTSEVLHDAPEMARVKHLEFRVEAHTKVIAPGKLSIHDGSDSVRHDINMPITLNVVQRTPHEAKDAETTHNGEEEEVTHYVNEKTSKERPPPPGDAQDSAGPSSEQLPTYKAATGQPSTAPPGPLYIQCSWGDEEMPRDIGSALGFRIFPTHAVALGRPITGGFREPICPDFTTYCIKHSHRLRWKMVLEIAGETVKFQSEQPVTVMGASQSSG